MAYRSGEVKTIISQIVYANDEFDFEYGLEPKLVHKPAKENRGEPEYVYAVFKLINGGEGFEVMSINDVREYAKKFSKSFTTGPWQTNFEEMAKKTIIKRVLKYAPLKSDFVKAVAVDEKSMTFDVKAAEKAEDEEIPAEYVIVDEETGEAIGNG